MNTRVLLLAVGLIAASAAPVFAADPTGTTPPPTLAPATPAVSLEERYTQLTEGWQFANDELVEVTTKVQAAAAEQPADVRWKIATAILQRSNGDAKGSVEALTALAKANPKNAEIQTQLGQSYMSTMSTDMGFMKMAGVASDAKAAWEAAIKIDPNHILARYALAQYQIQARKQGGFLFGSYGKAKGHGEALLKIPGDKARFWGLVTLGSIAAAQEEWAEMTKQYDAAEAVALTPALRNMVLSFHVNALVRDKKDAKAALPIVERAVASADADSYSIYYLRGSVRKELGQIPAAMEDFNLVLQKNPDAQNTRILLAECCESVGDKAAACTHYEEYVKRFPKGQRLGDAQKALKRLKTG